MALDKQGTFQKKATDLPDTPSPQYTANDIKTFMHTPSEELKTTLNNAIDKLNAKTSGNSGADHLGATGFDGLGSTIQTLLNQLNTNKTDKSGDHQGTWQGYTPSQVDQTLRDRVTTLEANDIEEIKSNANGTYIKFKNGILECFCTAQQMTANIANGSVYNSDIVTFPYPATFLSSKPVTATVHTLGINRWGVTTSDPASTSVGVRQFSTISSSTLISGYVHAKGWWK